MKRLGMGFIAVAGLTLCGMLFRALLPPQDSVVVQTLADGLTLTTIKRVTPHGEQAIHLVRGQRALGWRLDLALPLDAGGSSASSVLRRRTVASLAAGISAPVAVNGGFFAYDGAAVGAVKVKGEWIRLPWKNRSALGWDDQGRTRIDPLRGSARVVISEGDTLEISNLNGSAAPDGIAVLTTAYSSSYKLRAGETGVQVTSGRTVPVLAPSIRIKTGDWAMVGRGAGAERLRRLAPGSKAALEVTTSPSDWNDFGDILGAGPRLLRNGRAEVTEVQEEFLPDVIRRGPRTAMGILPDGDLLLLAIPSGISGMTLPELATFLGTQGVSQALNLDGGASTAMVASGKLVCRASTRDVPVANALALVRKTQR